MKNVNTTGLRHYFHAWWCAVGALGFTLKIGFRVWGLGAYCADRELSILLYSDIRYFHLSFVTCH